MRLTSTAAMALAVAVTAPAQVGWVVQGGGKVRATVVGKRSHELEPGKRLEVSAGAAAVHFPTNAAGKPASLAFATEDGDEVVVGVEPAAAAQVRRIALTGTEPSAVLTTKQNVDPVHILIVDGLPGDTGDDRVTTTVDDDGSSMFAVVARYRSDRGCYLLAFDRQAQKLQLRRWLGSDLSVVASAAVPAEQAKARRLTLQTQGFRIQGLLDDVVVLQSFDGALTRGAFGVAWSGDRPAFGELLVEPPAAMVASAALVQRREAATWFTRVAVPPGNLYVLELLLDRPQPPVPLSPAGVEPWLLQRSAAPRILLSDWRCSLGASATGEVPVDGRIRVELVWRGLSALRKQTALVRALLVDAEGRAITGTTPATRLVY